MDELQEIIQYHQYERAARLGYVVVACDCGDDNCTGWQMKQK